MPMQVPPVFSNQGRSKTFSDGLRIDTIATDIKVTTIQPGIVETDFSQVRFHGNKDKARFIKD